MITTGARGAGAEDRVRRRSCLSGVLRAGKRSPYLDLYDPRLLAQQREIRALYQLNTAVELGYQNKDEVPQPDYLQRRRAQGESEEVAALGWEGLLKRGWLETISGRGGTQIVRVSASGLTRHGAVVQAQRARLAAAQSSKAPAPKRASVQRPEIRRSEVTRRLAGIEIEEMRTAVKKAHFIHRIDLKTRLGDPNRLMLFAVQFDEPPDQELGDKVLGSLVLTTHRKTRRTILIVGEKKLAWPQVVKEHMHQRAATVFNDHGAPSPSQRLRSYEGAAAFEERLAKGESDLQAFVVVSHPEVMGRPDAQALRDMIVVLGIRDKAEAAKLLEKQRTLVHLALEDQRRAFRGAAAFDHALQAGKPEFQAYLSVLHQDPASRPSVEGLRATVVALGIRDKGAAERLHAGAKALWPFRPRMQLRAADAVLAFQAQVKKGKPDLEAFVELTHPKATPKVIPEQLRDLIMALGIRTREVADSLFETSRKFSRLTTVELEKTFLAAKLFRDLTQEGEPETDTYLNLTQPRTQHGVESSEGLRDALIGLRIRAARVAEKLHQSRLRLNQKSLAGLPPSRTGSSKWVQPWEEEEWD